MALRLSDLYLFSDVDGTLYTQATGIPQENIDALRRFTAKGGKFAIATGRPAIMSQSILSQLPINAPCICINGAGLYDTCKGRYVYTHELPVHAQKLTMELLREFPHFDIAVLTEHGYYYISDPEKAIRRMNLNRFTQNYLMAEPLPGKWYKVQLNVREEECEAVLAELRRRGYEGVDFSSSDTYFIEMMPVGVTKGTGLKKLCELLGIMPAQVVAVGDYYNDVEILRMAGLSACVAGAPDDIKDFVDLVLPECEHGAVARLVEHLERLYESTD